MEREVHRSHAMLMFVDLSLGVWLMYAPKVLQYGPALSTHDQTVGALIALIAILALRETIASIRWLNVPLGLWVMIAPFLLSGATRDAQVNGLITGGVVAVYAALRVLPESFRKVRWLPYRVERS